MRTTIDQVTDFAEVRCAELEASVSRDKEEVIWLVYELTLRVHCSTLERDVTTCLLTRAVPKKRSLCEHPIALQPSARIEIY